MKKGVYTSNPKSDSLRLAKIAHSTFFDWGSTKVQHPICKMHCERFYLNLKSRKGWRNVNGIFSFGQYILASLVGEVARRRSDGGVMLR